MLKTPKLRTGCVGGSLLADPDPPAGSTSVRASRRSQLRRCLELWAAMMAAILAMATWALAEEVEPDATLQLTQTSVALVVGYTWGSGTLTHQGTTYPVEVDGLSFLALGFARARVSAEVFNMKSVDHFNGTYVAGSAEATAFAGAGATIMRNQNGVVIQLYTTTEGLNLKLSPEGVRLYIK